MDTSATAERFFEAPLRTFLLLWVPVLFSLVAEPLTGLVDTAFVARLGAEPLAALGVGTVVLTSGLALCNFLSVGSQTEVSQAAGRGDLAAGRRFATLALCCGGTIGLVLMLAAAAFAPQIAAAMGAEDAVRDHAVTYIRIRAGGAPAVLLTMTSFGILYGLADMRTPLTVAVAVNVLNIVLDGLLIFGPGPFPALGIAGAALASSLSQWVGACWSCYRVRGALGFNRRIELADLMNLLRIGRDMALRTGSLILFLILATRAATQLGPEAGAAHQAVRQVWVFTTLFLDASAISAQSLIGFHFGSGRIAGARSVAAIVSLWSVAIGTVLMLVMIGGAKAAGTILVPPAGQPLFYPAWVVAAVVQPVAAAAYVTDGIHWGTGDFRYLRNGVIIATAGGVAGLMSLELLGLASLTGIWWMIGLWILVRAVVGLIRIWPGFGVSPLRRLRTR